MTTTPDRKPARRRRRRRDQLILDALEQLLEETPLRDLGVEEIAAAAGITRTRFYFYFKSKHEAYAALMRRVSDEVLAVYAQPDSWFEHPEGRQPRGAFAETFQRTLEVWAKHGAVLREAADLWNAAPDVREQWQRIVDELIDRMAATIERERERGAAPPGPDARRLAECLLWMGERMQFLVFTRAPGAMTPDELVDVGSTILMRAVYVDDDPA